LRSHATTRGLTHARPPLPCCGRAQGQTAARYAECYQAGNSEFSDLLELDKDDAECFDLFDELGKDGK
jgi:hypothetical protein